MLIDCHIHPAIDADTNICRHIPVGDFNNQVEILLRAGISRACGALVSRRPIASFQDVRQLNDAALRLRDAHPDFYIPGVSIHPAYPEESCRELKRVHAAGVRWVGELVGYMMGYGEEYATPPALSIMSTAADLGMVVNFHCGNLATIEALALAVPSLKLVLAHPGDGDEFLKRIELLAKLPNLHLDISGTGIDRYGMVRHAMNRAGKNKILFGSDFPVNNPAVYIHGARFEPLTQEEQDALFYANVLRLLEA